MGKGMDVNLTSVRKFRSEVAKTVNELREQLRETDRAITAVAEDWKDDIFGKFRDEFSEDKKQIEPLCKKLEEYQKLIHQIEKRIENYLGSYR